MPDRHGRNRVLAVLILLFAISSATSGADRFPRPEFATGYQLPQTQVPAPRSLFQDSMDVAVLILALAAAAWLGIRARSREGLYILTAFSMAYFGFYRKGCICSVGSIQNVALALADPTYAIPVFAVLFFALPLIAALLTGRSFCAGVCPLGAIQDVVVVKPLRLPRWLAVPLEFLPVVYLGLAVLFAANGAEFVICRFDPFISFYRLGGSLEMFGLGASFLALGTVVARPYCRFLCPYGVILGWLSRLSVLHVSITPDNCVKCRLCEDACPVDAIRAPDPRSAMPASRPDRKALAATLMLLPLLVMLGAGVGRFLAPALAAVHPEVRLADQVMREDARATRVSTLESDTFRASKRTKEDLFQGASAVRRRFAVSTPILGAFVAFIFALTLLATFRARRNSDHEPDRAKCLGCGRCFSRCPRERFIWREGTSP